MESTHDNLVELVELALAFGKVDRLTRHPDGTPESDTTHTVMLAIVCCYLNRTLGLGLAEGLIVQLALVHDLHEAICGDESTLRQDPAALAMKRWREASAIEELQSFPWVAERSQQYHQQASRESRFVRAVDKLLPKLTHLLNGGAVLKSERMSREEFHAAIMERQYRDMETYCRDLPEILQLHRHYGSLVEELLVTEKADCP
jgi:putative hydrolase of HD superfamily